MTDTVVARRYASAIFALGKKAGGKTLEQHGLFLHALNRLVGFSPELALALKSPVVTPEEKKAVVEKLLKLIKADAQISNFCFLLADKDRLGILQDIASCYYKLLLEEKGIIRGKLVTAIPLDAAKQKEFKTMLEKKASRQIELAFDVDKSILGGVLLQVGDQVLDASLRAQLAILRDTIKRGE